MKTFQGKTAVITGAASGFGLETSRLAAQAGMSIVMADVQQEPLNKAAAEIEALGAKVLPFRLDVSKAEQVEAMGRATVERFGVPHFVFNNAGISSGGLIWEHTLKDWEWIVGVNLMGVAHGIRVFTPMMLDAAKKDPGYEGHITNTASMAGMVNMPNMGSYNVTKNAVVAMSETLFQDLALVTDQVHCSVLCPFFVPTGIVHSERLRPAEMMEALPKIVWHLDDPVADPALVPLYFVAKKAAEHVTVVLSGEGADEFFGGYTIYREPLSLAAVNKLPDPVQRGLRKVASVIPEGVKGKSFLERGTTPLEQRYYGNARMFTEAEKRRLLRRYDEQVRYTDVTAPVYAEAAAAGLDPVTTMQYVDLYTWLRGDILVKADRMSMAHSLELRVPFLDREVFEVAATVPVDLKLPPRSTDTKYAMRQALRDVVPPAIVNRKKLGFPTPTRVWLRGEMYDWAHDILDRSGAGGLLDLDYARGLLEEHKRGDADQSRKVWTVLVFCIWHAIFIERSLDPGVSRNDSALLTKPVVGSVVA